MSITVVIPVFNAELYIKDAVESALAQPETGEVSMIDDGSTDGSLDICKQLASQYERVTLLQHANGCNRGAAASRNHGIQNAKYPYIAFLDADDYYLPGRFKHALALLDDDLTIDGVYEAVANQYCNHSARQYWYQLGGVDLMTMSEKIAPDDLFKRLVMGGHGAFQTNGVVFRKEALQKVGMFDEKFRVAQDTHLWIRMAYMMRLVAGRLDEPVAIRRLHITNSVLGDHNPRRYMRFQMWRQLIKWGKRLHLPNHDIDLLIIAFMKSGRRGLKETHLTATICRRTAVLVETALRHPQALRRSYYWTFFGRSLGITIH